MEQAGGSFMTGVRAFSAHLPPTSLLWPSTALRLFGPSSTYTAVPYFLDGMLQDIYDGGPLCPV